MPGLEPGIQTPTLGAWMAGSSPAMTGQDQRQLPLRGLAGICFSLQIQDQQVALGAGHTGEKEAFVLLLRTEALVAVIDVPFENLDPARPAHALFARCRNFHTLFFQERRHGFIAGNFINDPGTGDLHVEDFVEDQPRAPWR